MPRGTEDIWRAERDPLPVQASSRLGLAFITCAAETIAVRPRCSPPASQQSTASVLPDHRHRAPGGRVTTLPRAWSAGRAGATSTGRGSHGPPSRRRGGTRGVEHSRLRRTVSNGWEFLTAVRTDGHGGGCRAWRDGISQVKLAHLTVSDGPILFKRHQLRNLSFRTAVKSPTCSTQPVRN